MTTTWLYRLYDADGDLLYVGVTTKPRNRLYHHRKRAAWGHRITRTRFTVYGSLDAALAAERRTIRAERPRFNVVHNKPALLDPRPVPSPRCWFIIRAYDADGVLLKIGHTRCPEKWWRGQRQDRRWQQWPSRVERFRVQGPYEKPVMKRLVREARAHEAVAS